MEHCSDMYSLLSGSREPLLSSKKDDFKNNELEGRVEVTEDRDEFLSASRVYLISWQLCLWYGQWHTWLQLYSQEVDVSHQIK